MQNVIADLYKIPRLNGRYDLENKKLHRRGALVKLSTVEDVNLTSGQSGLHYIIDKEATEKWQKEHKAQVQERQKLQEAQRKASKAVVDLIANASNTEK